MAVAGRVMQFAEDRACGQLYNLLPDGSWEHLGRAQGRLWAPRAARLHLAVADGAALEPLARADPHAFYSIDLHGTSVADADLAALKCLVGLRRLFLSRARGVGDAGLPHLSGLWALKSLTLERTRVSDAGLPHLARLRALEELDLRGTCVRGGLADLRSLASLRRLDLSHTAVDDLAVEPLADLPSLEQVVLRGTLVTRKGALALARAARDLRVVRRSAPASALRRPALGA